MKKTGLKAIFLCIAYFLCINAAFTQNISSDDNFSKEDKEILDVIRLGTVEDVKNLIAGGADVNKEDCIMIPLSIAVSLPKQLDQFAGVLINTVKQQAIIAVNECDKNNNPDLCKERIYNEISKAKTELDKSFVQAKLEIEPYIIQIIDILLENGADINKFDKSIPPIHYLASTPPNESLNVLEHLLKKGANPNLKHKGIPPLFIASVANPKAFELLVNYGADKEYKDDKGRGYKEYKILFEMHERMKK